MSGTCFVYIAKMEAPFLSEHIVKVGISDNPRSRLCSLRTGCPFPINMFATLELPSREMARMLEKEFHELGEKHRLEGEWFVFHAPAALNNIGVSLAMLWVNRHGFHGLLDFLIKTGFGEDDARYAIDVSYGLEDAGL